MTAPPTDTAAALEAAIDAVIGAVRDDIGSDGMDTARAALLRALGVEA